MSKLTRALAELAKRADAGDQAARQAIRPTKKTIDDFSNEDSFYRIVDEDAYIDLVNSGAVRTNFGNKPGSTITDKLASRPTRYPSFSKGSANKTYAEGKPNHYIIETKDPSIKPSTEGRHGKGTTQFPTDSTGVHLESLPGEAVQVYRHIGDGQYRLVYDQGKVTPNATNAETNVAAPLGNISVPIAAAIAAGTMTPEEAQAGSGSKALAELAKRAAAGDQAARQGIRGYHGSPHDFPPVRELEMPDGAVVYQSMDDAVPEGARVIKEHPLGRFDMSKLGTGEGAQAYGHGLYFAEEEAVAKAYRDALKGRMVTTSDGVTKTYGQHITEVEDAIRAAHPNLNPDNIRAAAKSVVDDNLTDADVEGMGQWEGVYKSGIVANKNAQASKGSMYEVKIDAAAEDFLNWQTPLREQKKLLSALDDQYGDHEIVLQQLGLDIKYETPTGGDLAMALGMTRGGQTAPPRLLTDAGLKGVKYPAAFTRQKSPDKQSFNYVVFDDKLISIAKKYGISIPAAAAIAAGTMTPEEASASDIQANQGLVPFDKDIHTPRDVGFGGPSTEYTMTVDAPDGQVAVIPSIWWDTNGEPVVLDQRDAERRSFEYEQETGKQFPRFPAGDYELADEYAQARTRQGGASESPLASEYPSLGGMGVRMPPTAEDEEAMLAPTGGDLMQQANRDFADSIRTQPEPDFLTSVQQSLLSGIMKTAGVADLSADVVSAMAGPLLSAPGAIARYAADRYVPGVNYSAEEMAQGRRETEDYFNYQPRTEQGPQYGEQIMQGIGGAIAPYVPAIKKAAGDSYILGAMRQGYDYLGEREKELAKALMDLSPI
jgi:hypothetical protein